MVPSQCEVYSIFADLIPAAAKMQGEDLQWGRARQGLVPDYRLSLPTPNGPNNCLAELKFVLAGITWFPRGVEGKGTDRRAGNLPAEYRRKLSVLDQRFHGTESGRTGPLVPRLESFGKLECLVVGS